LVKGFLDGNASPTYGPVPLQPPNSLISPQEKDNLYPYSIADAAKLLSSHGWDVKPALVSFGGQHRAACHFPLEAPVIE
jgi:ABC-type transport system substrate-binding protein